MKDNAKILAFERFTWQAQVEFASSSPIPVLGQQQCFIFDPEPNKSPMDLQLPATEPPVQEGL
jgi:hypothetical protein